MNLVCNNLIISALLSFFIVGWNTCFAEEYSAGREYDVVLPGSGNSMKVYVPANYDSSRKWPLVVFYHGMNGSPTTDCIARHCEGSDFIVAGVTYCEKQAAKMTREQHNAYIERERKNFRSAVLWVKNNLSLDTGRVFLGGISKGGWTTSFVGEREMQNLAGFIILLAGRQRGAVPGPQKMDGFPVYIGAGEDDPNVISASHASGFYQHCGAAVCFEEYAGIGHQSPQKAKLLSQWLEAYGLLSHPWIESDEIQKRKEHYKYAYEKAVAQSDKSAACRDLKILLEDPRLRVACGEKTFRAIQSKLKSFAKSSPSIAKQLAAERSYYELVWKESKMKTLEETTVVVEGYQKLKKSAPDSRWAFYAEKSYARILPVYQAALEQLKSMKSQQKSSRQKTGTTTFGNTGRRGGVSF